MIIREKIGHLQSFPIEGRRVDPLPVEWFETGKRILHKRSTEGEELVLRFLKESPALAEGDVLHADEERVVVVHLLPCSVIVLRPAGLHEMALACYEIGNQHLPLFYDEGSLLMPYDAPVFRLLQSLGLAPAQEERQLLQPLRTSVAPHAHESGGGLLDRILRLAKTAGDE